MAKQVLLNARYFVGPADLTSQSNKVELIDAMEEKETTNFGSGGAKEVLAGTEAVALSAEGQWNSGDPGYIDDEFWASRRVIEAHTVCPETAALGALAYLTQAVRFDGKLFTNVGEVLPWMLVAGGSYPLARGGVLSSPGTAITGSGNGTGVQLTSYSATQRLYGTLHVLSISGTGPPTLAVTVQSGSSGAFGSPTTLLTFATRSTVGSEMVRTGFGPTTDTFYRCTFTVTGGTPSFLALVTVGIA